MNKELSPEHFGFEIKHEEKYNNILQESRTPVYGFKVKLWICCDPISFIFDLINQL